MAIETIPGTPHQVAALLERNKRKKAEKREFTISGRIIFHMIPVTNILTDIFDPDLVKMKIQALDTLFPWRDELDSTVHNDCIITNIGFVVTERHAHQSVFSITPPQPNVTKAQVYAYKKYLEKIAQHLIADATIPGFEAITIAVSTTTYEMFKRT